MNDSVALIACSRRLIADSPRDVYYYLILRLPLPAQRQGAVGCLCGSVGLENYVIEFAEACPLPAISIRQQLVAQYWLAGVAVRITVAVLEYEEFARPFGGA